MHEKASKNERIDQVHFVSPTQTRSYASSVLVSLSKVVINTQRIFPMIAIWAKGLLVLGDDWYKSTINFVVRDTN